MKRLLLRTLVVVTGLVMLAAGATYYVAATEAGARWALARVAAASSGTLSWSALEGTLLQGLRLEQVAVADGATVLALQRLQFAWQPWRLLDGTLVLDSVELSGLRYQAESGGAPLTAEALRTALFTLPVPVELRRFRVDGIEIRGAGTEAVVLDSLAGAALLDGTALVLSALVLEQGTTRVTGELRVTPDLALAGTLAWQAQQGGRSYAGMLVAGGTLRQLQVTHTLLQPAQVLSRGTVVPALFAGEQAGFALQHELPQQTLAAFGQAQWSLQGQVQTTGTAAQVRIAGDLQAVTADFAPLALGFLLTYAEGALAIDSATVTSTQIGLAGSGTLVLEPLALQLTWTLAALDAGARLPQLQFSGVTGAGTVRMNTGAAGFTTTLQVDALSGSLNGHPLAVAGTMTADDSGLNGLELRASSGANTLALSGRAQADLDLRWELQAPALGELWQGLGGDLHGSGSISGTAAAPQVNGSLTGSKLQLERDGSTFALASLALDAAYGANGNALELQLEDLTLTQANAVRALLQQGLLTLSGTPGEHVLAGTFTGPALALQFSLQGAGQMDAWRGTLEQATLDSDYGDWRLASPTALQYDAGDLALAEHCWAYLATRLCLSGGKAAGQGFDVDLALSAVPLAWLNAAAAAPASKPPGLQALQDAFALNLPDGMQTEGELDARFAVRNLRGAAWDSLDLVLQPRAAVVQLTQQLAAEELTLAPLVQRFSLAVHNSELHYADAGWSGGLDVQVAREDAGGSVAQGSVRGTASLQADGTLAGSAEVDFRDLAWLESVLPDVREPVGALAGSLGISGSRAQPQLLANLQLREGGFAVPAYGLTIHDAGFSLTTGADGVLRLAGTAQSGAGVLDLRAEISQALQPERSVTAEVNGEKFLALATADATATISPQLQARYAAGALSVDGLVTIADADIDLEAVFGASGDSAVLMSRDVVIVRGATTTATAVQDALPVTADLLLRLGENVHVYGYDLDALLDGELTLEKTPGRPVLVYGELGIPEGHYEIYNQRLSARDGRLVFFGNPANPVLDVRAFRETGTVEVGVLLTGNINDIQGQLYSTPTLPDNEILAILVTGKSFSSVNAAESDALLGAIASFGLRRGQGLTERVGSNLGLDSLTVGTGSTLQDSALGLGKYLTPDLLMHYKVGLFDRQSVLGIEYKLSEHLKLEVETGISQSVDLNYTIEKD